MGIFKIVINDPETRKSYQMEVDQEKASFLVGKKIGDQFDGNLIGLPGYTLEIRGGSDKDGFPMHPSVQGTAKKRILLAGPPGYHPPKKGVRKRKTVRGNTISFDIVQINCKVVKKGEKPLEEIFKKEEKKEEQKQQ